MMRAIALVLVILCSCKQEEPPAGAPVSRENRGPALPIDHPPITPRPPSGEVRRLSVAQLRGSLPAVMGNDALGRPITWMVGFFPGLDTFARALGEADYISVTEDNMEPSPLYVKFMDDAARDVCERALAADAVTDRVTPRTLARHVALTDTPASNPEGFDRNLRYLKLRFHAEKIPETDTARVAPLRDLFTAAGGGAEGWRALCVALVTAPEFHLY